MAEKHIAFPPAPASTTEQGLVADQQCLAGLTADHGVIEPTNKLLALHVQDSCVASTNSYSTHQPGPPKPRGADIRIALHGTLTFLY